MDILGKKSYNLRGQKRHVIFKSSVEHEFRAITQDIRELLLIKIILQKFFKSSEKPKENILQQQISH